MEKNNSRLEKSLLYGSLVIAVISIVVVFYTFLSSFGINDQKSMHDSDQSVVVEMGFTPFDVELAKDFMDKNSDGMCDFCGMKIEDCIASGMMECSMDPNAKMGLLRSAHIHADFKVYIDGKLINFVKPQYYMKSMMLHLDDNPDTQDAASVLHMHATGVPLWIFFKSIGMNLPDSIKLYVNGNFNTEGLNFVFKDGDKLLITDATDRDVIRQQILSITNYAKDH